MDIYTNEGVALRARGMCTWSGGACVCVSVSVGGPCRKCVCEWLSEEFRSPRGVGWLRRDPGLYGTWVLLSGYHLDVSVSTWVQEGYTFCVSRRECVWGRMGLCGYDCVGGAVVYIRG